MSLVWYVTAFSLQILAKDGDPQPFVAYESDSNEGNAPEPSSGNADNVIQAYKANVDVMAGLLLSLDQQGPSPDLAQQLRSAVLASVSSFVHTITRLQG